MWGHQQLGQGLNPATGKFREEVMLPDELGQGDYCTYPPRIADEVDVTEQVESGVTRYVVRNRATSRYFLLKQPEYQIFLRVDGTNPVGDIASPPPSAPGPRAT